MESELCEICSKEPYSHSFKLLNTEYVYIYYTNIANAKKYNDVNGIISHYNLYLSKLPCDKKWVYIVDCHELSAKHLVCFEVAMTLCKLINDKYNQSLIKIVILNPNMYIHMIYNMIWAFLTKEMADKVIYDYNFNTLNYWVNYNYDSN